MNGNVVVACSLLYVFPFFVLCFTKGEGQHSVYGESVGCEVKYITLVWACTENGKKWSSQKSIIYEFGNNEAERHTKR